MTDLLHYTTLFGNGFRQREARMSPKKKLKVFKGWGGGWGRGPAKEGPYLQVVKYYTASHYGIEEWEPNQGFVQEEV